VQFHLLQPCAVAACMLATYAVCLHLGVISISALMFHIPLVSGLGKTRSSLTQTPKECEISMQLSVRQF
jgi:hypothetical protein